MRILPFLLIFACAETPKEYNVIAGGFTLTYDRSEEYVYIGYDTVSNWIRYKYEEIVIDEKGDTLDTFGKLGIYTTKPFWIAFGSNEMPGEWFKIDMNNVVD